MAGVKLLAIETSSPIFSVALCDGPEVVGFLQADGQGRPSSLLTDLLAQALEKAGLRMRELDGFAVSIGPGSFTGLRTGVMTVKTIGWALKKPVLPISSLEVIARNADSSARDVLVFLDARKGNVYSALFSPEGAGSLQRAGPDELLAPAEALNRIRQPALVVGDGLKKYGDLLKALALGAAEPAAAGLWVPRADVLGRIAAARWPEGRVDDAHTLVPQYLYSQESDVTAK